MLSLARDIYCVEIDPRYVLQEVYLNIPTCTITVNHKSKTVIKYGYCFMKVGNVR